MKERTLSTDQMINMIEDFLSLDSNSTWTICVEDSVCRFRFTGCRYSVLIAIFKWIRKRLITPEESKEVKFVKCYHPSINKTHLSDYILVPEERVYEHTKNMYKDI